MDQKLIKRLEDRLEEVERRLKIAENKDSVSIVVFSGEWDKLFAAFTIATGALALGKEVHMFFTFWGATALRNPGGATGNERQSWLQRIFNLMLPKTVNRTPLSRMNMLGLGRLAVRKLAKSKGVEDLPDLIHEAKALGVNIHCCDTSMQLFGWSCSTLKDGDQVNLCGVASFISKAMESKTTLFI